MLKRALGPAVPLFTLALIASACAQRPGSDDDLANGQVDDSQSITQRGPSVGLAAHHDESAPLMLLEPAERIPRVEHEPKPIPHGRGGGNFVNLPRENLQNTAVSLAAPTTLLSFDGVGNGFTGPAGAFSVNSAPPDTNGDVGPNHYVQTVNSDFAIFNKSGTVVYGPVPINTLFSGFGGGCQTNNDGDPVVLYDPIANRWVISQFSVSSTPYMQCVAVSQTPDPTGAYYRYSFSYGNTDFNDYPKMGVWPDAYYVSYNIFANASSFSGAKVCAFDRAKMLTGAAATQQCFNTTNAWGGLLPADLDGARLPPTGAPNYVVAFDVNDLGIWKFHVDWTTPANSTFTGPTILAVPAFTQACNGGTCIPQSGTSQKLDSLADRMMYRLAYRNFADGHQALVTTHAVTAGSSTGIRWYELRPDSSSNLSVFQSGTYAPDSGYRWMSSIAQDQQGNMALGFSLSSSSLKPQVHYTGRLAGDAAGQMTQGEGSIVDGAGVQTGSSLSRWGDYSMMSVDPTDDCTFWYTTEYLKANGAFNWSTRIGSFKFPGCGSTASNDFSISANPTALTLDRSATGTSAISTATTSGSAQSVALSISGLPSGATATFSPTSVTSGGSSTLTVNSGTAAAGTYSVTVTGTGSSATHTVSLSLTVNGAPPANDFSVSASPASLTLNQNATGTSTIATATTSGSAQTVSFSISGLPSGATATFSPTSVTSGASATLTVASGTAAAGSYTLTVTGRGTTLTHSATIGLTVNGPPPANDFSINASPASVSIQQGASGTSTISTAVTSGSAQSVALSVSGAPSGVSASLSPASVTAGGSSTLTITVSSSAAAGSYTLTVTGTAASGSHTKAIALTVTAAPPPGNGIVNGGFETGSLSGWSASGTAAAVAGGHTGSYAARAGSTSATNGDSSISQTFTVPAAGGTLLFWYKVVCPDTVTYDWVTATLTDNGTGTVSSLAKTCTNNGTWVQVTGTLVAGHSYTLKLISHDDNYAGDATYTLFDDVSIGAPPASGIANGGFEDGSFTGWTRTGTTSILNVPHSGTYAALAGNTVATNGDSSVIQTFTVPSGKTKLSLYYANDCRKDYLAYAWVTITLKNNTTGVTTTLVPKTCGTQYIWTNVQASVTAGSSYTLTMTNHDDGYSADPVYTLFDDVVLQ